MTNAEVVRRSKKITNDEDPNLYHEDSKEDLPFFGAWPSRAAATKKYGTINQQQIV